MWWLFDRAHVFRNREYAVVTITEGSKLVHRAAIFPPYARFPFMADADLQVGDVWTDPDHRGGGLAAASLRFIRDACGRDHRQIWYLTAEANEASRRAAQKAGFSLAGQGRRVGRRGVRMLGAYVLDEVGAAC